MRFPLIILTAAFLSGCQDMGNQADDQYSVEIEDTSFAAPVDTAKPKPIEIIGYGVIVNKVGSDVWKEPVNLFSSTLESRTIIGKVYPNDTVGIVEKGDTYWWVVDKANPDNYGYLMKEWVMELKK